MSVADYFDVERMAAEPDKTFLSVQGAEMVLYWRDLLEAAGYYPFTAPDSRDIYGAAGWLIAHEHAEDIDLMTLAILLTFIA